MRRFVSDSGCVFSSTCSYPMLIVNTNDIDRYSITFAADYYLPVDLAS